MVQYRRWLNNRAFRPPDPGAAGFSRSGRVIVVLLVVALLALASMAHLKLTSQATTISYRIRELEQRKQDLLSEKGQILFEIAKATDLAVLRERAGELEFVPAQDIEYLAVAAPISTVSQANSTASTAGEKDAQSSFQVSRTGDGKAGGPGWWERLLDQFAVWATVEPEVTPTPTPGPVR